MNLLDVITITIITVSIIIAQCYKYYQEKNGKTTENNKIDEICNKYKIIIWCFFIFIIFISVIYKFGTFPKTLFVDEAGTIYDANNIAKYGVDRYLNSFPIYLINFGGGQSSLLCYLMVVFIKIFGSNIISYRLPMLLVYLIAIIASYKMILKSKDLKTALVFTFIVITLPWNITSTRTALDCNLYAGMFMIDLFLMNLAKKNYQYILAGISVGITLYTYSLSWITLPLFILLWIGYMIYLKKINLKQIALFMVPLLILAIPLILFLLVNYEIIGEFNIGIISIPKIPVFRQNEISILNIFKYGIESFTTLFTYTNTIYPIYILLSIIGIALAIVNSIKKIKKKEYDIETVITFGYIILLLGIFTTRNQTANKLNVLYIPMMYFVTISIIKLFKNIPKLIIITLLVVTVLFVNFEYLYYSGDGENISEQFFCDKSYYMLVEKIEKDEELRDVEKYIYINRTEGFIYQLYVEPISPYEFDKIKENDYTFIKKLGKYHYYRRLYRKNEFLKESLEKSNDSIAIVSKSIKDVNEKINTEYEKRLEYEDLYIYSNESLYIKIENALSN